MGWPVVRQATGHQTASLGSRPRNDEGNCDNDDNNNNNNNVIFNHWVSIDWTVNQWQSMLFTERDQIKDGNDKILRMNEILILEQDTNVKFGVQA